MEYNLSSHRHYNQPIIDGLWTGRSVAAPVDMREMIIREIEKEKIREEILTEGLQRRRILEAEVLRELKLERQVAAVRGIRRFPSSSSSLGQTLHTDGYLLEPFPTIVESARIAMPRYDRDIGGFEVVRNPKIGTLTVYQSNDDKKGMIGLGKPSCSKRKSPAAAKKKDFRCGPCKIDATSERTLKEHLLGKKHLAKMAAMSRKIVKGRKKIKKP